MTMQSMQETTGIDQIKRRIDAYCQTESGASFLDLTPDEHADCVVLVRRILRALTDELELWEQALRAHTHHSKGKDT